MSHIDSFDHVLVGYFAGLPVYRPLEDIDPPPPGQGRDFGCRTDQLVIGGGSGEHPGLVLERPGAAMAAFALDCEAFVFPPDERERLRQVIAASPVHQRYDWDWDPQWSTSFEARCRSNALPNPFSGDGYELDDWLTLGFGEFCLAAMPELDQEMAQRLLAFKREPLRHVRYSNILLQPPGLPVYARSGTAFEATLRHRVKRSRTDPGAMN